MDVEDYWLGLANSKVYELKLRHGMSFVRSVALLGWPEGLPLELDCPALRQAIQRRAIAWSVAEQ